MTSVKDLTGLQADSSVAAAIQSASSTAIWGTPPTWIAAIAIRRVTWVDHAALGGGAEEQPDGRPLVGDHQRALRQLPGPPGQRLPRGRVADAELAVDLLGVEEPQRDAGLDRRDRHRVVGRPRALKAPSRSRSSASCSTGVRVRSGSSPIWRKKTR